MSAQGNARPIIVKRKKVIAGGGHHGGAWKVAYADFVTAMMAFFMLMWLLNATTEKQRKGIADYFSPTIPVNRISGGGDGTFGGDSIFTENALAKNGTGATSMRPTEARAARGDTGNTIDIKESAQSDEIFKALEAELLGKGGESKVLENKLRHINTRVTDEGLVIEVFALKDTPLFEKSSNQPTELLRSLAQLISDTAKTVENGIAVAGHVQSQPIVIAERTVWKLSADRASTMRRLMEGLGIASDRLERVTSHADRELAVRNPMAVRNNRLEIVLLRE